MYEQIQQLDVSNFDDRDELADAIEAKVREMAEQWGQNADIEVSRHSYEDHETIAWEGGPNSWAVKLLGGDPIIGTEPTIVGFRESKFTIDAGYSFSIEIYD